MSKKVILNGFLIATAFFIIISLPLRLAYQSLELGQYSRTTDIIIKFTIVFLLAFWFIKKHQLAVWGGFRSPNISSYWLLLLPFVFPGMLTYSKINSECLNALFLTALPAFVFGLVEEIVFRGVIQGYLVKNKADWSYHRVVIYTALLFSLGHLINLRNDHIYSVLNQLVYAFYMGLLFSALQLRVNNVWLLGIAHGLINFLFKGCGTSEELYLEETPVFLDYLESIGMFILLFSPIFLFYWILMKGAKHKLHSKRPE